MKKLRTLTGVIIVSFFAACQPGVQKGAALSRIHINYIRRLGLLAGDEHIILFDSQYKIKVSGNFFTNRRLAAYWTDENDPAKSYINYAFYPDIDSIKRRYFKVSADVSYLEVYKSDGEKFRVFVKADSAATKCFFNSAVLMWEKSKLAALKYTMQQ
ncbi:hypothetical protein [Mucilaginibacter sp.]|uniref:hypothetical protein n=1 Tax=Mucilaginibacter sp. TaxID=1882438 RepID=UPI0025EDE8ED|nr:hypothetical protein [Mucilaginibacter sp.]